MFVNVEIEQKYWESYLYGLLDDVTSNMDKRGFETFDSDVDDDRGKIEFFSLDNVDDMMKEVLIYRNKVNRSRSVCKTLWDFLEQECSFEIVYSDCSDVECGMDHGVRLIFPTERLPRFNELFFEVFPKENIQQVSNQ